MCVVEADRTRKFPHSNGGDLGESAVVQLLIRDHEHWCRNVVVSRQHESVAVHPSYLLLLIVRFLLVLFRAAEALSLLVISGHKALGRGRKCHA